MSWSTEIWESAGDLGSLASHSRETAGSACACYKTQVKVLPRISALEEYSCLFCVSDRFQENCRPSLYQEKPVCIPTSRHICIAGTDRVISLSPFCSCSGLALSSSCCTSALTERGQLWRTLSSSMQWTSATLTELFPSKPETSSANELASFRHCLAGCGAGWKVKLSKRYISLHVSLNFSPSLGASSPSKLQARGRESCHGDPHIPIPLRALPQYCSRMTASWSAWPQLWKEKVITFLQGWSSLYAV